MIFQDPEMPKSQVLITISAKLQYLLSCAKFCTNAATLLLLSEKALFLPPPIDTSTIFTSSPTLMSETTWNMRQKESPTQSRNFQQRHEMRQAQHRQSQGKVSPGLRKWTHAPNSLQLITHASTAPFHYREYFSLQQIQMPAGTAPLQSTASWHRQCTYQRKMTTYFKY